MPPTTGSNQGEASLHWLGSLKLTQTCSTLVPGILLIAIFSGLLKTSRYETADPLNSEYWPLWAGERTVLCLLDHRYVELFYFFTSNDDSVGRLQGPTTFEVGTAVLYYPATHPSTKTFRRCPICLCSFPMFDVRSHTHILASSALS